MCGPVPGSHAGSTLHMLGISERQASRGEAPGWLPAGSCPQPGYGGLSPAAAPEMGARGLSQRMLTPLVGLCSTGVGGGVGRCCTRRVWQQGDALGAQSFSAAPPARVLGLDTPPGILSWLVSWNFPSFGLYLGSAANNPVSHRQPSWGLAPAGSTEGVGTAP